ncbi:MAG: aminotransferase class I/II-fold pyridoxal phosphate-dependent enzyme [Chloroflexota bacterium]
MQLKPFKLERYFAQYEFSAPYLLSPSDCEPLTIPELISFASDERRQQWETLWLGYTESQGHPELLSLISDLYTQITPQQVMTAVPEEAIFIAMNTLIHSGEHMIVMHPGYQSLYEIAEGRGVEVSFWQPPSQWRFDPDTLETLRQDNTRMLVVNTPHNPTGAHFTVEEWDAIIAFAQKYDLWLFADEMYRYSEYDDSDRLVAACDAYEKAISLSGLSKSFALPGLRVGWLATQHQEALNRFTTFKDYTTICGSAPSEILAIIALEAKSAILERNLAIISHNLSVLDDFFQIHDKHFKWMRPKAGTITFVDYLGDESIQELADNLVETKGLMILPASVYDYQGNYFRLGFGRRNMPEALQLFGDYLTEK